MTRLLSSSMAALLSLLMPARCGARRAATAIVPDLLAVDVPTLNGGLSAPWALPRVERIVAARQGTLPTPWSTERGDYAASSRLLQGAANFIAARGGEPCDASYTSYTIEEPPATFMSDAALAGGGDVKTIPGWFHSVPRCEDGSLFTTLQVEDTQGGRQKKEVTTFCAAGQCVTETKVGDSVLLGNRYGDLSKPRGPKDSVSVTFVSRIDESGRYEELEVFTTCVDGACNKEEERFVEPGKEDRVESKKELAQEAPAAAETPADTKRMETLAVAKEAAVAVPEATDAAPAPAESGPAMLAASEPAPAPADSAPPVVASVEPAPAPAESAPAVVASVEPAPVPAESKPAVVASAESAPAPSESAPAVVASVEPAPVPAESNPSVVASVEPAPAPAESKPAMIASAEPAPVAAESKPAVVAFVEPAPAPADSAPAVVASTEPAPAESKPTVIASAEPAPASVQSKPAMVASVEPARAVAESKPAVVASAEPAPAAAESKPAMVASVEPAPAPAESVPAAVASAEQAPAPAESAPAVVASAESAPAPADSAPVVVASAEPAPASAESAPSDLFEEPTKVATVAVASGTAAAAAASSIAEATDLQEVLQDMAWEASTAPPSLVAKAPVAAVDDMANVGAAASSWSKELED